MRLLILNVVTIAILVTPLLAKDVAKTNLRANSGSSSKPAESALSQSAKVVAGLFAQNAKRFAKAPVLKISEFNKFEIGDYVLIDARADQEIAVSKIPNAISKKEFEANQKKYQGKPVVVYCTIGYRSGKYAESLKAKGINAYNLEGSILGWVHSGGKVVNQDGAEVKRVHVYGKKWDYLPEGYEGIK